MNSLMSASLYMELALLLPLLAVIPAIYCRQRLLLRDIVIFILALFTCGLVWNASSSVTGPFGVTLTTVMPGISIAFSIETLGSIFALMVTGLWAIATLYTHGYLITNRKQHQPRFLICYALSITVSLGVAFADNFFTLFLCYELLTLVTYPLVAHQGDGTARAGARTYLYMLLGTSMFLLLPAMIAIYSLTGTLQFTAGGVLIGKVGPLATGIVLLLCVYGVGKAAMMPLHRWLPAAMVAPSPVSALLHAVAVVKTGVFTLIKLVVYIFGIEHLQQMMAVDFYAGSWLAPLAALSVVCAAFMALQQDDLKTRLAYSTISQLGYVVLAVSFFHASAVLAAMVQMLAHAFAKITLFFGAGAITTMTGKKRVSELYGMGYVMPWSMAAFTLAGVALIGLPPALGFFAKFELISEAAASAQHLILVAIVISTLLSAAYVLPILIRLWCYPPTEQTPKTGRSQIRKEAPFSMALAMWCGALLAILGAFFLLDPVITAISAMGQYE